MWNCVHYIKWEEEIRMMKDMPIRAYYTKKLYYGPERTSIITEPFLAPFIIRQNRCYDMVKGFRMIHLYPVGEFMNDNIIYDLLGGKDKSPVEVQIAKAAAASPAGFLFSD